jgi:hypothetical protein
MPGTPYITAGMLLARPAGISWNVVPTLTAPGPEQVAQLEQECWTATSVLDRYCHQQLRAQINTETGVGPGQPRVAVDRCTGLTTLVTRRWPVVAVEAVQAALAPPWGQFPPAWAAVPSGQWFIPNPPVVSSGPAPPTGPSGGNLIQVAPGFVDWARGRGAWNVMWSYQSGFGPHTSLTDDAAEGDSTLKVDDVTGWAGVTGFAYDSTVTEAVEVASAGAAVPVTLPGVGGTVQAGQGDLTLALPLQHAHAKGTVISALPADILRAAALQAAVQALETLGAIIVQSVSGQMPGVANMASEVELILDSYARVI